MQKTNINNTKIKRTYHPGRCRIQTHGKVYSNQTHFGIWIKALSIKRKSRKESRYLMTMVKVEFSVRLFKM